MKIATQIFFKVTPWSMKIAIIQILFVTLALVRDKMLQLLWSVASQG